MAFEVNRKFEVKIEADGEILKHLFRYPTPKEFIDFSSKRYSGTTQVFRSGCPTEITHDMSDSSFIEASLDLWNACCEDVEGYTSEGKPLNCEVKGWREKIWMPHKVAAARRLAENFDRVKEAIEKN